MYKVDIEIRAVRDNNTHISDIAILMYESGQEEIIPSVLCRQKKLDKMTNYNSKELIFGFAEQINDKTDMHLMGEIDTKHHHISYYQKIDGVEFSKDNFPVEEFDKLINEDLKSYFEVITKDVVGKGISETIGHVITENHADELYIIMKENPVVSNG